VESDAKQIDLLKKLRRRKGSGTSRGLLPGFLELQIPMTLGAVACYLLGRMIAATSRFAAVYHAGTALYAMADALYLSLPVVAWMLARGYSQRHSLEIAAAMLAPLAAVGLIGELAHTDTLRWLITGGYPAMCAGMLAYMLFHREGFRTL
jgi:hypothetical protein